MSAAIKKAASISLTDPTLAPNERIFYYNPEQRTHNIEYALILRQAFCNIISRRRMSFFEKLREGLAGKNIDPLLEEKAGGYDRVGKSGN